MVFRILGLTRIIAPSTSIVAVQIHAMMICVMIRVVAQLMTAATATPTVMVSIVIVLHLFVLEIVFVVRMMLGRATHSTRIEGRVHVFVPTELCWATRKLSGPSRYGLAYCEREALLGLLVGGHKNIYFIYELNAPRLNKQSFLFYIERLNQQKKKESKTIKTLYEVVVAQRKT